MRQDAAARRVLVTGPVHSLEAYLEAARAAEWEPVGWPLLAVAPLDVDLTERIDGLPDRIALTSTSALEALEHAAQRMPELLSVPFACVGERSAERAHAAGFKVSLSPAADASELAERLLADLAPGSTILWPRGARSRELGDALEAAGHTVLDPVVYETRPTEDEPPAGAHAARAVLLASPSAVAAYLGRELAATPRIALAIGATTARALDDHRERFDAILSLDRPLPEAFAASLHQLSDRP